MPSSCTVPEVQGPGGPAPPRVPGSIRRTTTIDMHWPEGRGAPMHLVARGRDLQTGTDGTTSVIDSSEIEGSAFISRQLISVRDDRADPRLAKLSGAKAGGELRARLRQLFPEFEHDGLTYLLLDDLAGATLISSWSWFAWDGYSRQLADRIHKVGIGGKKGNMAGVCIGFAHGSSSMDDRGRPHIGEQASTTVDPLKHPGDPLGWHDHPDFPGPCSRRARWIELQRVGAELLVSAGFQDSALRPDGSRLAVHEYRLTARVDAHSGAIRTLQAVPHVLPHFGCPQAIPNLSLLQGCTAHDLRRQVPVLLARELGCTHLNDVLRGLSAVPMLARHLPD